MIAASVDAQAMADRDVGYAQRVLDGLLTDRDLGNPVSDRELDRARKALDAANAAARAVRVTADRARRKRADTLAAEAKAAHEDHLARLREAIEAHTMALGAFEEWSSGNPSRAVRETAAAVVGLLPRAIVEQSALVNYLPRLPTRLEHEAFFRAGGASVFPSDRAVRPAMPSSFMQSYTALRPEFEAEAAAIVRQVEAAAPGEAQPVAA
ncbi:MAG: hypothetical protein DYH14_04740 [Betaproteobacteria bacterium PRO3]|nr:hypothetical protein [Betaproteobacteria bacterium PRO3]